MIKTLLVASSLLLLSSSWASTDSTHCKLPPGEKITIGCTYKCDFATRFRLRAVAAMMGYKVKFENLNKKKDSKASEILSSVDAVLIPGGADIHPKFYLKDVTPELREYTLNNLHLAILTEEGKKRDLFEYTLLKVYLQSPEKYSTLPVFGICRGMQMMSVAKGLPLYLDIKTELGIPNRKYKFDRIHVEDKDSLMSSLYGDRRFYGWEMHHQGIRVDYYEAHKAEFQNVKVASFSNDRKVAESIEYTDLTAMGVQYHPEKSLPETTFPLFKWLLNKACTHKTSSKE